MAEGGWNTIESDAGVFTSLLTNLSVQGVQFEELISLDPLHLSSLSPLGVIFLFKYPTSHTFQSKSSNNNTLDEEAQRRKKEGKPQDGEFDYTCLSQSGNTEAVWFAAQTIQNACGTQALLSVLMNIRQRQDTREEVKLGTTLSEFKEFTGSFDAELKGEALSNSDAIRDAHNAFARSSPFLADPSLHRDSEPSEDVYHFIAYMPINNTLYELDGLQPAPISHGQCTEEQFSENVLSVLQKRIGRYPDGEIRFNLLAMCRDLRVRMREVGDVEGLEREEDKRRAWRWENALRRHNFVGFAGELIKGVVREKIKKNEYDSWVKESMEKTKKLEEMKRARRAGVAGGDEMDTE